MSRRLMVGEAIRLRVLAAATTRPPAVVVSLVMAHTILASTARLEQTASITPVATVVMATKVGRVVRPMVDLVFQDIRRAVLAVGAVAADRKVADSLNSVQVVISAVAVASVVPVVTEETEQMAEMALSVATATAVAMAM